MREYDTSIDLDDNGLDPALTEISHRVIGACIAVHKELGPGYQEAIYANALAIEFFSRGIRFEREVPFSVQYKGQKVGESRLDFLVEGQVIVELKSVETLNPVFTAQVISYLRATGRKLALLVNFNTRKLVDGVRRIAG